MNINASLFVQMVVFLLGAWVTMKYIWPPLIHAIEERQKKIADGLAAANKGEKALAVATEQGQAIEAAARARASATMVEADRIIESAKAEADVQVQRARDQLRDQVADLAVQGAEQILAREVDKTVHAQLLDQLKAKL